MSNLVEQRWSVPGGTIVFIVTTVEPLSSEVVGQIGRVIECVENFAALCGYGAVVDLP